MALLPSLVSSIVLNTLTFFLVLWDLVLFILNCFLPSLPPGKINAYGGKFPEYRAPGEDDSRSPCPALNALANHGILPANGRNIPFTTVTAGIRKTYNFAPTFCIYAPLFAANLLGRSYWSGTLDLSDLSVHNGIAHDASLLRHDSIHQPDQGKPAHDLISALLASGTGPGGALTARDLAGALERRRKESRMTNGQYTMSAFHKTFSSSNAATLLFAFPSLTDLSPFLHEERLPPGWEPGVRAWWGLTMTRFNATVMSIEAKVRDEGGIWGVVGVEKGKKVM